MILTFKCSDTEALFNGKRIPRFVNIQVVALRKLAMLNRAQKLEDLRIPPNNKLEQLKRDRVGQWSIRITINGAYASASRGAMPTMLRSSITIKGE